MTTARPDAATPPAPRRARLLRRTLTGLGVLVLVASVVGNVVLYREAKLNYRRASEVRLDPHGLMHADFPTDAPPGDAARGLPAVVFFGDSRARGWPAPNVPGYRFVNRGVDSQTTAQVLGRFDAHVTALSPRVVVVQAGINDLKAVPLLPHRRDQIVADCKANLREVVQRASSSGATVVLTTVFPTGDVPLHRRTVWSPQVETAVQEVNAYLRMLASDRVILLDAWKLLEHNGRLREGCGVDTLHLSETGYAVLNAELVERLRALAHRGGGMRSPGD